jgi:hypothetical protein
VSKLAAGQRAETPVSSNNLAVSLIAVLLCGLFTPAAAECQQRTDTTTPMRIGGAVSAPKLISRATRNLRWPDPNQCYQLGAAVFEGVIDKTGAVRELKLVKGPDNEFTRARRDELLQDKYSPGMYRGKPVDVKITIAVNHVPVKKVKGPC